MFEYIKEWLIILIIIMTTSFFVLAEIAIITSKKIKLQKLVEEGSRGAKKAIILKEQPENFLSTVQVGITLMSIIIGFYSGSEITKDLAEFLKQFSIIMPYHEGVANFVIILFITYLTVLGEIVPKRLAMLYPERFAIIVPYAMNIFMKTCYPLIMLLSASAKFILRLLKVQNQHAEVTTDEIKMIITQAENEGTVDETEMNMIKRLIHLSDIKVGTIMTPRKQITYLNLHDSLDKNLKKLSNAPYHYFPIAKGDLDELVGVVSVKELLRKKLSGNILNIEPQNKEILYIPEMARLTKLLQMFKEKQVRIAIVLDEYGEIEGVVTLNDILKTFIGDLATQIKGQTPSIIKKKNGAFSVNGNVLIEEIKELLQISSLPDEEEGYRTISSFILKQLNRMPQVGDCFQAAAHSFKVTKMEKFRIERIYIKSIKS